MAEDSEASNHADSLAESTINPSTASISTNAQEQAPPPPVNDPEATQTTAGPSNSSLPPSSTTTSKRKNKWPAYFFPNLATQRMAFCIDVLKREDIKSVCEFGCGPGAVLRPMTNGASHIDSFPEPIFDESALLAEAKEEEENANNGTKPEGEAEEENTYGEDETLHRSVSQAPSEQATEEADSIAPSDSASRRQSVQSIREVPEVSEEKEETEDGASDSRGRSPPRGRGGFVSPPVDFVRSTSPEPISASTKAILNMEILEKYRQLPGPRPQDKELHLRRIAGLDLTEDILLEAIDVTSPPPEEPSPFITYFDYSPRERWEDLRVELWQGSLDVYNDALDNFEAFVMTEVIEHLHARQLDKFPDILFGSYRPRIIVITTPNYDFNQYFDKAKGSSSSAVIAADGHEPGTKLMLGEKPEDETKSSFKDPTGRTDRYFRDDDHKFEWTQQEFKQWCEMITSKYDYTVEISGVGSLKNYFGKGGMYTLDESKEESQQAEGEKKVPPPHIQELLDSVPDPSKMFATQTAVFRRKFAYESERSPRSPIQMPLAFYGVKSRPGSGSGSSPVGRAAAAGALSARKSAKQRSNENGDGSGRDYDSSASRSPDQRHKLLKAHYFKASPQAGNSKSAKQIRRVLDELMRDRMRARSASLRELWGRSEIAQVCGGYINKLVQALVLDKSKAWDIEFDAAALEKGGQVEDAVMIILKDFVEPERVYHNPFGDDHVAGRNVDEAEDEEAASRIIQGRSGGNDSDSDSEDDDGEYASRKHDDDDEKEATTIAIPKLSKKQRKQKRMEEAPFLLPIFPLEHEPTWMPAQGTQEAEVWDVWANPARASTMITEQEWAEESKTQQASGWD